MSSSQKFSVSVPNCSGRFDTLTAHAQVGSPWAIDAGLTWSFPRFLGSKISAIFESGRRNENHVADSSYKLSAQGFVTFNRKIASELMIHVASLQLSSHGSGSQFLTRWIGEMVRRELSVSSIYRILNCL